MAPKPITVEVDGKILQETQDGKPLYEVDGNRVTFDGPTIYDALETAKSEAKGRRKALEEAEARLKLFEGIDDPDSARKALKTVADLDSKSLIDAGKADEVKRQAIAAMEEGMNQRLAAKDAELASLMEERDTLSSQLTTTVIRGEFLGSQWIKENTTAHPNALMDIFGKHFKVEDGKPVGYDAAGNKIYSKTDHGQLAGFDEAFQTVLGQYPYKDDFLKGANPGGGGGGGGGAGGGKTIPRAEWDRMDQADRMAAAKEGKKVV